MPSSYTTSLRLTLPATGELSGVWGNTVNTGITELVDASIAGTTTISTWGGAGVAYTLTNNSGATDEARRMVIVATGAPGEAKNVICPAVSKLYVFRNDTTGGFALTLKTAAGAGIAVPAGQYKFLYCNGTDVVEAFNSAGSLILSGALSVGGAVTLTSNPTLSAGTANGVAYLNGSKVVTTGSGLVFDGTNLGIGKTPTAKLDVLGTVGQIQSGAIGTNVIWDVGTSATRVRMAAAAATNDFLTDSAQSDGLIYSPADRLLVGTAGAKDTLFYTNNTERARITSGGDLLVGTTSNPNNYKTHIVTSASSIALGIFANNATTPSGINIYYGAAAPNNSNANTSYLYCNDTSTVRIQLSSNGGIQNYQANDINLSDRREKTNFAPAKFYLDTICAIPVQTFNYIDQSEDDPGLTLGVVAQDVQAVAPELVMESNWGTEDNPKMRLSIYQTDLQYALMKCIQELKAEVDTLRARVAALEAA